MLGQMSAHLFSRRPRQFASWPSALSAICIPGRQIRSLWQIGARCCQARRDFITTGAVEKDKAREGIPYTCISPTEVILLEPVKLRFHSDLHFGALGKLGRPYGARRDSGRFGQDMRVASDHEQSSVAPS